MEKKYYTYKEAQDFLLEVLNYGNKDISRYDLDELFVDIFQPKFDFWEFQPGSEQFIDYKDTDYPDIAEEIRNAFFDNAEYFLAPWSLVLDCVEVETFVTDDDASVPGFTLTYKLCDPQKKEYDSPFIVAVPMQHEDYHDKNWKDCAVLKGGPISMKDLIAELDKELSNRFSRRDDQIGETLYKYQAVLSAPLNGKYSTAEEVVVKVSVDRPRPAS